jgi:hypothetical protein
MWKKFSTNIILLALGLLIVFGGINFLVDPYGIYSDKPNYSKKEVGSHLRLFKSVAIRKQHADVLLFGDSQVEHGINPKFLEKITNQSVFNASFTSMRIYEFRKYLELALQYHKPKTIVYGTQMYNYSGDVKFKDDYDEQYLDRYYIAYAKMLSIDMLFDSMKIIKQLNKEQRAERDENGLCHDFSENPCRARFLANEKHYIFDNAPKLKSFKYDDGTSTFDEYAKIIHICHDNNITLLLFVSPSHARQWEATAVGNGWDTFESWKKQLVILNEKIAKEKNKKPFVIWDFSGYHDLTSEAVPDKSDEKAKMKYFYESSHYTPALGDIVLDRMFDGNFSGGKNYPGFGVKLTSQNIAAHLLKLRTEREAWRLTHPQDVKEIEALKTKKL